EARHVRDLLQAAGECGEEEERESDLREDDRGRREGVVERPPGDGERDRADGGAFHVRVSLTRSAQPEATRPTAARPVVTPKASASASPSQPVTIRLRTPSIR